MKTQVCALLLTGILCGSLQGAEGARAKTDDAEKPSVDEAMAKHCGVRFVTGRSASLNCRHIRSVA